MNVSIKMAEFNEIKVFEIYIVIIYCLIFAHVLVFKILQVKFSWYSICRNGLL